MSDELIDYSDYLDDKLRISHTVRNDSPLMPVPNSSVVDTTDGLERHNIRKQIRVRKKAIAGLHHEIRYLEGLLDE